MKTYTEAELNEFSKKHLIQLLLQQQEQLNRLNDNMERLIEQIRVMNTGRFGRKTERLDQIDGQMNFGSIIFLVGLTIPQVLAAARQP